MPLSVSRPDGRSCYGRKAAGEESPGSIDIRCRITSGGGDPRESATENEPPASALRGFGAARVKRCGKSAPRVRQRKRHGKPHREQDRIGTANAGRSRKRKHRGGDVRLAVRVGCSRQCANIVPEEWSSRIASRKRGGALQNPAYRPADVYLEMRGSAQHAGPLAICGARQSATIFCSNAISAPEALMALLEKIVAERP